MNKNSIFLKAEKKGMYIPPSFLVTYYSFLKNSSKARCCSSDK